MGRGYTELDSGSSRHKWVKCKTCGYVIDTYASYITLAFKKCKNCGTRGEWEGCYSDDEEKNKKL